MISIYLCYMNHRRIIYKDSERRVQRQTEIAFPTWLCRAASYLRIDKIVKGERRDKRKSHSRLGYAEPHPIFVLTKIAEAM